jgi:hypothetical protein
MGGDSMMADVDKKQLHYLIKTAVSIIKTTITVDAFGSIAKFSAVPAPKQEAMTPEELHYLVDETIKAARDGGDLPKHAQAKLPEEKKEGS